MEDNILITTIRLCRMATEDTKAIDILNKLKEIFPNESEETREVTSP